MKIENKIENKIETQKAHSRASWETSIERKKLLLAWRYMKSDHFGRTSS